MANNTAFFKIQVEGADKLEANLTALTKRGNELKKTKSELTKELKALDTASKTYSKDSKALNKNLASTNIELKENNRALNKNQKEYIESSEAIQTATGSIVQLRSQLKKATGSYDRMSASQRNNEAIGGKQQARINALSNSLKKLEANTGRNQRSVGNYGNAVKGVLPLMGGFGSQLSMISSQMGSLKGSIGGSLGSFKGLGGALKGVALGGFGIALAGVVALFKNIKTIIAFEQQMAKVKAITGASVEEFNKLKASSKELGATTQLTATEFGQLQEELAKLGFTTEEILASQASIGELAIATQSDLAQASRVTAGTLNAFGLEASETQRVVDVMSKSFTSSALDINKLELGLPKVASASKAMGISLEETVATLGVLADSNIKAETASTGFRNILLKTKKAGTTVSASLKEIRESTEPATKALELFGVENAVVALVLADNEKAVDDFTVKLQDAEGATAEMAKTVGDTLAGDLKSLASAWEGVVLSFGDGTSNVLRPLIQFFTEFVRGVQKVVEVFGDLYDSSQTLRKAIVLIKSPFVNFFQAIKMPIKLTILGFKTLFNVIDTFKKDGFKAGAKALVSGITEVKNATVKANKELSDKFKKDLAETAIVSEKAKEVEVDATKEAEKQKALAQKKADALKIAQLVKSIADKKKIADKAIKESLKATEKLNEETRKNNLETSVLEIADKRTAEDKKFEIEKAEALRSIKLSGATKKAQREAVEAINAQFDAKEAQQTADREEEDRKKAEKALEKLTEENEKEAETKRTQQRLIADSVISIAKQTGNALVEVAGRKADREKNIELANLDAKLQQGLITQADFEAKKVEIEKKAFAKKKKLEIANIAISLATEIASIASASAGNPLNAFTGGTAGAIQSKILAGTAIVRSGIQAGIVASQKFAGGGVLSGASHANGGIPFTINGQSGFEAEGGETIINKRSSKMFANELNAINQAGGGVALASPNTNALSKFANGGTLPQTDVALDSSGLSEEISNAIISAVQSIKVVNVAEETTGESDRVKQIDNINTF